jgi:hypothetical protein
MTRKGERSGRWLVRAAARRLAGSDDSGATLILALIFITVVSIVTASILSFVDTGMRTTVAVRGEAGQAAAADGAAQIAVNTIRTNTYAGLSGTHCFGASDTQNLSNFYTGNDGANYSASVVCQKDDPDSRAGGGYFGFKPTYSLLTLGTSAGDGITLDRGVSFGGGFSATGDIYSNASIVVHPSLDTTGSVSARGLCTNNITADGGKHCNLGASESDPNYSAPSGPLQPPSTMPKCTLLGGSYQVLTFQPGLYTDAGVLNGFTGPGSLCSKPILNFTHGVYYFDFSNLNNTWTVADGFVVGGTANTPLDHNIGDHMPGSCKSPVPPNPMPPGWTHPAADQGVTFIFGGQSRLNVTDNSILGIGPAGHVELCGNYSTDSPPLAIYALKSDIKVGKTTVMHAGCDPCDVITSQGLKSGQLEIQGTTYLPKGRIDIGVVVETGQGFNAGVVARSFDISAPFSGSGDIGPVSALPASPTTGRTVVYLSVFVCTGAGPCPTGAGVKKQLGLKVGIGDPNGLPTAAKRQVTVYNWSIQRT